MSQKCWVVLVENINDLGADILGSFSKYDDAIIKIFKTLDHENESTKDIYRNEMLSDWFSDEKLKCKIVGSYLDPNMIESWANCKIILEKKLLQQNECTGSLRSIISGPFGQKYSVHETTICTFS